MKKLVLLLFLLSLTAFGFTQDKYLSKAFFGVESNHISSEKAERLNLNNKSGAYVTEVIENSSAESIGIKPFDYLTGFNDIPFTSQKTFSHSINEFHEGDQATVQFIRNDQQMSMPVTFGKQADAIYRKMPKDDEPFLGVKQDHYNWKENVPGVKVNIIDNSAAQELGLQDDDIITKINDNKIIDWHDLGTAVDNMKPGEMIKITYLRNEKEFTNTTSLKSYGQTYNRKSHNNKETQSQAQAVDNNEIVNSETPAILQEILEPEMEDVTQEEADDMKEKLGVDMPVINNLEIEKLNIFPNPTNGLFNLTFDLPNKGQTSIRIFNGVGRLIYQNDMQQFSGAFTDRLDISNRAKGIYFLEVNQEGKSITKKIILQ